MSSANSTEDSPKAETVAKPIGHLLALPTDEELQACWELCRLFDNMGFWVIWLPTAWSMMMTYHHEPQIKLLDCIIRASIYVPLCFGIQSLIMTIDDLLDYDVDALVQRTKNRAIPRGAISLERAWLFFAMQVVVGACLAVTVISPTALRIAMMIFPVYLAYPTCKRWTNLAPIPLGIMFKVGVFMGWSEVTHEENIPWETLLPVYISGILWTLTYEIVYQHQDKVDDARIGLYSPALLLQSYTIPVCTVTAFGFLGLLSYGGWVNGQGMPFYTGVAIAAVMLLPPLWKTDLDVPEQCKRYFLRTPNIGKVILAGLVVDVISHRLRNGLPL